MVYNVELGRVAGLAWDGESLRYGGYRGSPRGVAHSLGDCLRFPAFGCPIPGAWIVDYKRWDYA